MTKNMSLYPASLPAGEVIDGKYTIVSKIGQGWTGTIYKARDPMKRQVVLRLLTHVDDETLLKFRRDAATLGTVRNRAVVRIDGFGHSPHGPYVVVQYVEGRDLASLAQVPLPVEEAVDLAIAMCSGVSACHAVHVVHSDLKPSNVRVRNVNRWSERVKILDFGLAVPFDSPILKAYQARITAVGSQPEAPRYLAPELLRHEGPTPQSDQYGIASMLYLLLTGRAPFHGLEGEYLLHAILNGDYVSIGRFRSDIPSELRSAITRGLSLDPAERFPTVNDFALAIVAHATASLKIAYTKYFTSAQQPIDRRLIDPVSARKQSSPPPLPAHIKPLVAKILMPFQEPAPQKPAPDDVVLLSSEPPTPSPAPPTTSTAGPPIDPIKPIPSPGWPPASSPILMFTYGIVLGAALAVGAVISFQAYQRHVSAYPSDIRGGHGSVVSRHHQSAMP